MADLTPLTTMQAGTVTAYGDIFKMFLGFFKELGPVFGTISAVSAVSGALILKHTSETAKRNTLASTTNTTAHAETTLALKTAQAELAKTKEELEKKFELFTKRIDEAGNKIAADSEKIKIVMVKVFNASDRMLSESKNTTEAIKRHEFEIKRLKNGVANLIKDAGEK